MHRAVRVQSGPLRDDSMFSPCSVALWREACSRPRFIEPPSRGGREARAAATCILELANTMNPNVPAASLSIDEDEDEDVSQRQCVQCRVMSPPTRSVLTLISGQNGWRITRVPLPEGGYRLDWRCATCWMHFRARK